MEIFFLKDILRNLSRYQILKSLFSPPIKPPRQMTID